MKRFIEGTDRNSVIGSSGASLGGLNASLRLATTGLSSPVLAPRESPHGQLLMMSPETDPLSHFSKSRGA